MTASVRLATIATLSWTGMSVNEKTRFGKRNWKIAGIVALFGTGLVVSGVLRLYNLHAENPSQWTAYSTLIYIGITVIAAVLLSRAGVPMKRLGFGPTFKPATYLLLAAAGVGLIQLSGLLLDPATERVFGQTPDLARFSDIARSNYKKGLLLRLIDISTTTL